MRAAVRNRKTSGPAVALAAALALAMPGPAGAGEDEAWNAERAFLEMERLQAEIGVLRALAGAQAALLAWNRVHAETLGPGSGAGPVTLAAHLCREDGLGEWCRALPATFGAQAATAADERQGKDGRR